MQKIKDVSTSVLEIPFDKPIRSALGTYIGADWVVVRVHSEDGIDGFGYSMSLDRRGTKAVVSYVEEDLKPLALGKDATVPETLWRQLWSPNKARMRGGVGVHALSAVDTAVWDIAAKAAGQSLFEMLGGADRDVQVYGSGGWLSLSDEELIAEAQEHVERGINSYKLKIGGDRDRERIDLLRREMGDGFILYTDANQSYSADQAIEAATWLRDYNVGWLEEPVLADCPWDLQTVAENSPLPIAAGENVYFDWGFKDICDRKAAAFLQPDIGRCGGVTEWDKIAKRAEAAGVKLTSHLLHELSTTMIGAYASGFAVEYMNFFKVNPFTEDYTVNDGCLQVPDTPGHGVTFTDEAFAAFRI